MKRLGFLLMLGACWGGESPVAPERVPLGVLSRDATRIFVTGADGGIEALEASTGKRIWFSPAALRPLMDVGGKLIAWVPEMGKPNVLRIATLSAADGKTLELSSPIPLPEWACLNREKPAHLFEMEAVLLGNASLRVSWRADAWPRSEERRVGKECTSWCRSRWSPYH